MRLNFNFLILILICALPFSSKASSSKNFSAKIPVEHWTYPPQGSSLRFPVVAGLSLPDQLSPKTPCCWGTYQTSVPSSELVNLQKPLAIYFPETGGLVSLSLNGIQLLSERRSPSSSGTVVLLSKEISESEVLEFSVEVRAPATNLSGMWKSAPIITTQANATDIYEDSLYFQRISPILNAIILGVFASLFFLIYYSVNKKIKKYRDFGCVLLSWSFFYVFLSGIVRDWSFAAGCVLHYPVRLIASWAVFGLLSQQITQNFSINKRLVNSTFLLAIFFNAFLGLFGEPILQKELLVFVNLICVVPLIAFGTHQKNSLSVFFIVTGFISYVGQLSDSFKLLEAQLGIVYPLPFVNRFTFLPLLILSFGDCVITFAKSFSDLRLSHLRDRVRSYATYLLLRSTFEEKPVRDQIEKILSKFGIRAFTFTPKFFGSDIQRKISGNTSINLEDIIAVSEASPSVLPFNKVAKKEIFSHVEMILQRQLEQKRRLDTELRFSKIVRQLDPSLYDFIASNENLSGNESDVSSAVRGIIFFDQKGYTTLLEDLDENSANILSDIVGRWVADKASKYGGRIKNFSGDAYTLEIYPFGNENLTAVALRVTGLVWELSSTLDELNKALLKARIDPITFRFGANLGSASGVKLDYISPGLSNMVGDNVNIAARLQSIAPPGGIYISGELHKLVGEFYLSKRVPRSYVKGRRSEVEVYEIIGRLKSNTPSGVAA